MPKETTRRLRLHHLAHQHRTTTIQWLVSFTNEEERVHTMTVECIVNGMSELVFCDIMLLNREMISF
jgi:hypothetical protein